MDKARLWKGFQIMVQGMTNTLLTFRDKYYKYGKEADFRDPGTSIGGTESSFNTDLTVEYTILKCRREFLDCLYNKAYRDDIMLVFNEKMKQDRLSQWLKNFQEKVNNLFESDNLQFTMELWQPNIKSKFKNNTENNKKKVSFNETQLSEFCETYESYMQTLQPKLQVRIFCKRKFQLLQPSASHKKFH